MAKLPQSAKLLIVWLSAMASIVVASALSGWRADDPLRLAAWIALAGVAGTMKVRFPGLQSSYSFGYIVVLAAIGLLPLAEATIISIITALVQCYWQPLHRPMGVQVLFNVFNYAISVAVSWHAYHGLERVASDLSMAARFTFAAGVFFLLNTGLVSWILALLNGRRLMDVWESSHSLIFPYYMVGAACAGVLASHESTRIGVLVALLPLLAILYGSMRASTRNAAA
jgi:hypothetical protein